MFQIKMKEFVFLKKIIVTSKSWIEIADCATYIHSTFASGQIGFATFNIV